MLQAYKVSDDKNTKELTKALQMLLPKDINLISKYGAYTGVVEATGLVIFAGVFLGLVFLAATGSIIYFKQLTEATIDKDKYSILRKLGVSKQTILNRLQNKWPSYSFCRLLSVACIVLSLYMRFLIYLV